MMGELKKKIGPLELWQWIAIGTAAGVALYLFKSGHATAKAEVNPEEEEKLLGSLERGGGGGGETGGSSAGTPAVAAPEVGPAGPAGAAGESPNIAPLEAGLQAVQSDEAALRAELQNNNPPSAETHQGAAQGKGSQLVKNSKGEGYRTVEKKGKTFHEYPGRKGADKLVRVGGAKPKSTGDAQKHKPAKRPKPTPIHKRVTVQHAPAKRPAPHPVVKHAAKPKPRKRR